MPQALAESLLVCAALYALCGALYAARFLTRRIERVDPCAHGSGWGFRLLILPGVVALWPLLWRRTHRIQEHTP